MKFVLSLMVLSFASFSMAQSNLPKVVSGCKEADYAMGGFTASVVTQGLNYSPKCLQVQMGSDVTIAASGTHPLIGQGGANNPIDDSASVTTTTTYHFDKEGVYGYDCERHESSGMKGAVWVVK